MLEVGDTVKITTATGTPLTTPTTPTTEPTPARKPRNRAPKQPAKAKAETNGGGDKLYLVLDMDEKAFYEVLESDLPTHGATVFTKAHLRIVEARPMVPTVTFK